MTEIITLEPTFADAIKTIAAATDLPEQTRRHWCSSLAGIARAFDQPPEVIPARYSAVRARMAALHHVPLDWVPKTLANHKSNAKAALIWFAREKDVLSHGVPLSPVWDQLRVRLTDPSARYRLMPLMRFCSGVGVEPSAVDEAVIDRYLDHRTRTTARASDPASRRILARLWNAAAGKIEGWPQLRLVEPPVKSAEGPTWDYFPQGLRADIESHLAGLSRVHRNKAGQRIRPCKSSTITTRRRELVAAVRMAVSIGIPIASLNSLSALIHPDVAEKVLEAYWKKDGDVPKTYTINLSCRFVALARAGGFDEDDLRRIEDFRFTLEQQREDGMTPKNLALIRRVLTDGVWSRVVNLPEQLMRQARHDRSRAAAALLTVITFNWLFMGTVVGFFCSAALVLSVTIPQPQSSERKGGIYENTTRGIRIYLATPRLRGLLALNLSVAAAGAMVIVNTVVVVRGMLRGTDGDVAIALACFGGGSMVAALS